MKTRVTLSLDEAQVRQVDLYCVRTRRTRSAAIAEAIAAWGEKRQADELAAGYEAMAQEDRQGAEERLAAWAGLEEGGEPR